MKHFRPEDLKAYAAALLQAAGYTPAHAEHSSDILVWANARGADSHGVLRIPRYVEMVKLGIINPVAEPETLSQEGAIAVLEAGRAPGPSAMISAMDTAVDIAGRLGIGWCSVRNITHAGAVGYFALRAAEKGYLGIVMTASGPLMAYHGARVAGVSTNPISFAAPSNERPLLFDMSTSTAALGKIMQAKDAKTAIPPNWAIDENGDPTTDPAAVATLTPLSGPKGSGLSMMVEVLASVLVSNPVISKALSGEKGAMNGAALAIRIDSFGDPAVFAQHITDLAIQLKKLPKTPGTEEILMPGERGFRLSDHRMQNGIPIADGTLKRLAEVADRFGVAQPDALETTAEFTHPGE